MTVAELTALGHCVDRAERISKLVVDASFEERRTGLTEAHGQMLAAALRKISERLELDARQPSLIPVVVPEVSRTFSGSEPHGRPLGPRTPWAGANLWRASPEA